MSAVDRSDAPTDEFWLFGYGRIPGWVTGYVRRFWQASQDHRGTPDAPGRVVTLIERSYWEQLADHHGSAPDRVWGVAYRIVPDRVAEVKEYLDIREINGYTIHYAPFHPAGAEAAGAPPPQDGDSDHLATKKKTTTALHSGQIIRTLVYIGTPDNDQFVGPQDPQELAEHIYRSAGPSGLNRDYLWGLEQALAELGPESGDEHVTDLSNRVRAIAAREEAEKERGRKREEKEGRGVPPAAPAVGFGVSEGVLQRERQHHEQHHDFRKVKSVDEQEETEKAS